MLEHTQRAHTSYFNKKIDQMIIIINECMYEKGIRILRLEHLQTMIEMQEKHMEGIYSSYKTPIEEQDMISTSTTIKRNIKRTWATNQSRKSVRYL